MRSTGPGPGWWMQWKSCRGKFTRKFLRRRIDAASDTEQGCRTLRNSGAGFVCGGGDCAEIWRGSGFFVRAGEGFDRCDDRAQQQHFQRIRHDYPRNPFAAPYVLGVSYGAAVGSVLALIIEPHLALRPEIAAVFTPLGGFIGATLTIAAVYLLGRYHGDIDSKTLLLSGVIVGSFFSAMILLLITMLPSSSTRGVAYWLMGDLSTPMPPILGWVLRTGFFAGFALIYLTASDWNLLLAGEKEAMHLGVDVKKVQLVVYLAASALTGLAVSVSGSIGYVGLIVPHLMRMIFGTDYRMLLPASAFGGAIAVVIADTMARTVAAPSELAVGAVTAIA